MNAGWDGDRQGFIERVGSSCDPERMSCPASLLGDLVQFVSLRLADKAIIALALRDEEKPRDKGWNIVRKCCEFLKFFDGQQSFSIVVVFTKLYSF